MGPILKGIGMTALAVEKFGGDAARKMLKTLYKGKRKLGKQVEKGAAFAGKEGYTKTSKFISGTRKKAHKGSRLFGQAIKENPKLSSFIAGGYVSKKLNEDD
jgi:hypothetical protein